MRDPDGLWRHVGVEPPPVHAVASVAKDIEQGGSLAWGEVAFFGWRAAFEIAGWVAVAAMTLVLLAAPRAPPPASEGPPTALLDFRPVLRNRAAMAYALTYCVHTWEMSVLRGWIVAFLAYVALTAPDRQPKFVII